MTLRGVPARLAALYASIASSVLVVKRTATIEAIAELSNLLNRAVPVNDYEAGLADAVRLINGSNCKRELNPAYLVLLMDGPSIANLFRIDGIVNIQWNPQEKGFVVTDLARTPRAGETAAPSADDDLFTDVMIHARPYQSGTPYFGTDRHSGSQSRRSNRPRGDYNRDNHNDRDNRDDRGNTNNSSGRADDRAPRTSGSNRGQRDHIRDDRDNRGPTRVPRGNRNDDGRRDGPRRGAPQGRRRDDNSGSAPSTGFVQYIQPRKPPLITPMSTSQCVEMQQAALAATKDQRRDVRMEAITASVDTKIFPWAGRIEETKAIINEGAQLASTGFQPVTPAVASTATSSVASTETSSAVTAAGTVSAMSTASPAAGEITKKPSAKELALSAEWY